jgi:hypothetical protein
MMESAGNIFSNKMKNIGFILQICTFCWIISISLCEKRCTLSYENEIHIANCSGIGLDHIPFQLHHNIKILDLRNNALKVIGANAFAKYDMLTKLYLQNNSIQEIKKNAFAQLTQLKHLDLSINQLKTIPSSGFPGLTSLLVLNLKGNKFSNLQDEAFSGLPSLTSLYLDGNYIDFVGPDAFQGLIYLQTLELQNNNLKTLNELSVQYFTKQFKSFKLYDNPWFCDCRIRWLQQYLHNSSYHNLIHWIFPEGEPKCNGPNLVKDKAFSSLDESDYICEVIMYSSNQDITLLSGEEVELYCNYYADPFQLPKWTKNGKEIITTQAKYRNYEIRTKQKSMTYSTLKILDFSSRDMGEYKCSVENARNSGSLKFVVSLKGYKFNPSAVTTSDVDESDNSRNNHTIKITLSVVGGFLLLLIIIGFLIFGVLRYRRNHQRKSEERSQTFKEHLKTNVLNHSDLTDSDKYDKKQPVENGDIEIMECEPLYAQVRKEMNPNNTYVSFQGEYNEPEENGGFSSSNQTKGSDSSQCESTSPLLDDCSPIPCESHDLIYDPSHGGSFYHTPHPIARAQTLNSRFLPSLSSYDTYDTYLSYSTPYSTLSRNGNYSQGSHNGSYHNGHYPMNGTHTLPLQSANKVPHKSASTSYIGPLPPKKPPRVFHSRDSMSLSQTSSSGSEPSHTTTKLSLPKPGTVDQYGTAV